jgi:hypothetical protein
MYYSLRTDWQLGGDKMTGTVEHTFALGDLITEAVEEAEVFDVHAIADTIAMRIPEENTREVLAVLVRDRVRTWANNQRRCRGDIEDRGVSERWRNAQDHQRSGALEIYRWQVNVDPGRGLYKDFGDCTMEEVERIVQDLEKRAIEMADQGRRFAAALKLGRRLKVATVSDIPAERLAKIFYA